MKEFCEQYNLYIYDYTAGIKECMRNFKTHNVNYKLSINIMVKDEERCISRCIQSIYELADEIIVIDTGSTDKTKDIINQFGKKVILSEQIWNNNFAEIRNMMIEKSSGDIIFMIDADEYLDITTDIKKLKETINILFSSINTPFAICPIISDSTGSEFIHLRRIFRKKDKLHYVGYVHEDIRSLDGKEIELVYSNVILNHDGYNEKIVRKKNKINRNLTLLKKTIEIEEDNARWYYFIARDLFNSNHAIEIIYPFIKQCEKYLLNTYEGNRLCEGIWSLKGQVYLKDKNIEGLQKVIKYLIQNYPNNIDRIYFEIFLLQNKINKIYEQINEKQKEYIEIEDKKSFINSNGSHIMDMLFWQLWSNMNYEKALEVLKEQKKEKKDNNIVFIIDAIIANIQMQLIELKQELPET